MNASQIFILLLGLNGMVRVYVRANEYYYSEVFSIKSVGQAPSGKTVYGINAPESIDPQKLLELCEKLNIEIQDLATNYLESSSDVNDVYEVIVNSGDSPIYINAFVCIGSETSIYLRVEDGGNILYGYSKEVVPDE